MDASGFDTLARPMDGTGGQGLGEWFEGACWVCGEPSRFVRQRRGTGSAFRCPSCRGQLRYQGQARALVRHFSRHGASCFAELVQEHEFRQLRIYEPGRLGPFRPYLRGHPGYEVSVFVPEAPKGESVDGVRNEDLMALTYESDTFDLVITSDVFEHVRRPYVGFAEVYRVLRTGGAHIFSIPGEWSMRKRTVERVDTSGEEDVHILEPKYHRTALVYNDFGLDIVDRLDEIGFETEIQRFRSTSPAASKLLTFCSFKHTKRDRACSRDESRRP